MEATSNLGPEADCASMAAIATMCNARDAIPTKAMGLSFTAIP